MHSASGEVLQLDGLNELEIAELRKAFRLQGVDLDAISEVSESPLDGTKLGEPGTAVLIFSLGKIALPLIALVLSGWLAKPRSGKRHSSIDITLKNGEMTFRRVSSSEFAEGESPASIQEKLIEGFAPRRES